MQNNTFSTLFVGQNLIKLSAVDSTNNYLKNLLSNSEPLPEGTVIMADDQYAGRGQQNNTWHSDPGKNLTFSLLLTPVFLPLKQQFLLNMAVCIGINRALKNIIADQVNIKWPNDIYYKDKKLGGILIENTIVGNGLKNTIVGIGININQQHFPEILKNKVISVAQILQADVNLELTLAEICNQIESLYLQLKAGKHTFLRNEYVSSLYKINTPAMYRQNGEVFEGIITGVSDTGLLNVSRDDKVTSYNFKEIEFLTTNNETIKQ